MSKTVIIGSFVDEESLNFGERWDDHAIVVIDVVRATTTITTAAALGRQCFVVPSVAMAMDLAVKLPKPLLAGEQAGTLPHGFHIDNSPAGIASREDIDRPLILVSSSGTRLCHAAAKIAATLPACLRNYFAVANYVQRYEKVALIGAATKSEFREEDQLCCALIANLLLEAGYSPDSIATAAVVKRWENRPTNSWMLGKSAAFLRRAGRIADLNFIAEHVADLNSVYQFHGAAVIGVGHSESPVAVGDSRAGTAP